MHASYSVIGISVAQWLRCLVQRRRLCDQFPELVRLDKALNLHLNCILDQLNEQCWLMCNFISLYNVTALHFGVIYSCLL